MRISLLIAAAVVVVADPSPAQSPHAPDSAYLVRFNTRVGDRAWYAGQISRGVRSVEIAGVHSASSCQRRTVEFTFLTSIPPGGVAPTLRVGGVWYDGSQITRDRVKYFLPGDLRDASRPPEPVTEDARISPSGCIATVYWRLSDSPGRNVLVARLVRDTFPVLDSAAMRSTVSYNATGHVPPALIAGLAYQFGERDRGSTSKDTVVETRRRYEPILGIDFPLLLHLRNSFQDHVRPMVATHYSDPGFDIYVGVEVLPLVGRGAREVANPFQASIGAKKLHRGGWTAFIAGHYNASSLLGGFLGALGNR